MSAGPRQNFFPAVRLAVRSTAGAPLSQRRLRRGEYRQLQGLFAGDGRLLAVATHNTDIADGWEREGESKEFFDRFSIQSYAISINILVYAMTH